MGNTEEVGVDAIDEEEENEDEAAADVVEGEANKAIEETTGDGGWDFF